MKGKLKRKIEKMNSERTPKRLWSTQTPQSIPHSTVLNSCKGQREYYRQSTVQETSNDQSLMRDLLNRVLNIEVSQKISFQILKKRIYTAIHPHLQISFQTLTPKDSVGKKALTNGKVLIKICGFMELSPSFNLDRLVSYLNKYCIRFLSAHIAEFKQFYFKLIENHSVQDKQNMSNLHYNRKSNIKEEKSIIKSEICKKVFQQRQQNTCPTEAFISQISLKSGVSFSTDDSQTSSINTQISSTMVQIFQECKLFHLSNIHIVGIVQTDYKKRGQYAIVLCRPKNQQQETLSVFSIRNEINYSVLLQVRGDYEVKGWIHNHENINIGEFWEMNLEEIMP